MGDHFRSDLLASGGDIPKGHYEAENMKATVVPFRDGVMLSIAAGLAESNGAGLSSSLRTLRIMRSQCGNQRFDLRVHKAKYTFC
jgi:7-cyano-7-deazaguanine synthase in queuosine biosynthesis